MLPGAAQPWTPMGQSLLDECHKFGFPIVVCGAEVTSPGGPGLPHLLPCLPEPGEWVEVSWLSVCCHREEN